MSSLPSTMSAWIYRKPGKPIDVLSLEPSWPVGPLNAGELLVKVHSASLNPGSTKFMRTFPLTMAITKPATPESDFCGSVVVAGGEFAVGDVVCGSNFPQMMKGHGALAEYLPVSPASIARVPASVDCVHAASLPIVGITSLWTLATRAKVGPGSRVFINGGTSGTGLIAVQVARHLGAYVVCTGNPASKELLTKLGADEVIDYRAVGPLPAYLKKNFSEKPFDLIYDTVGVGAIFNASAAYLKPRGLYLDIAGSTRQDTFVDFLSFVWAINSRKYLPRILGGVPRTYEWFLVPEGEKQQTLKDLLELVAEGKVRAVIDSEHSFADVKEAYRVSNSGRAKGKVVVRVS